ncbi:Beta-1,3-galactosyltransferase 1 [Desmophyllum pertusum]|uniref:Hexosyltransferase n=1 Tax=Desmophyllum pertusum TaxID=174260 RepID=A0A9X0CV46_9CNID|nr:Beta-1,3-galactosyltransferase 1 [Desmophyllum pertusum]
MKIIRYLFATIVCIQVIAMVAFYMYMYIGHDNRILINSRQESNITTGTSLQMRTSADYMENSTKHVLLKNIRTSCSQLAFSFVSHITQPHFDNNNNTNLFLLVLVTSGVEKSYLTRRNSVRNTWGNEASHPASRDWKRVFLLGRIQSTEIDQESSEFNDILVLNMTDNYNNLVIKVFSGLLWSMIHVNPHFILKADDDVYVRIPYLITWLENYGGDTFYGGHVIPDGAEVNREVTWKNQILKDCLAEDYFPPYCSGPFYVISSSILPSLFQSVQNWTAFPAEDAYIGILARENGLKPVSMPGFDLRQLKDYGKCTWASAIALGHRFDLLELSFVEKKLQETSRLPRDYYKCLMNDWAVTIFLIIIPSITFVVAVTFVKLLSCQRSIAYPTS